MEFIGEGRGNKSIGKALQQSEKKAQILEMELNGLRRLKAKIFQAPPKEWIEEKLSKIQKLLGQDTTRSALVIRKLLSPIKFEPTYPDVGKP